MVIFGGGFSTALVVVALIALWAIFIRGEEGPQQPIAFSHELHAGDLGIDCTFCHRNVAKGAAAGIPAAEQCAFCHAVIAKDSPEVQKVLTALETNQPIDWVRVHRLPDHVRFVHEVHIRFFSQRDNVPASAVCATCHGNVAAMERVKQVRLLRMGDCVDCHREFNAPTDCVVCHY